MNLNNQPNILVVDDNRANRKLVGELLKHLDIQTAMADDGYEAIEKCKSTGFDLILMDIQMPGLNGQETCAEIRKLEKTGRTPIVALTAESVNEQKTQLLLSDLDDFLSKPISENDLKNIIDRWIFTPVSFSARKEASLNSPPTPTTKEPPSASQNAKEINPTAIFNLSESLRLSKQLPDLAVDMLNLLLDSINETKQGLIQALSDNDMSALSEVAHKFHGGCCYCGVPSLKHAVKTLEIQINKPDADNISELTQTVLDEMDRLKEWADEHDIEALFLG